MADADNSQENQGSIGPAADRRQRSDETDQHEHANRQMQRSSHDYFSSRGFQIFVTILFTILILVLCACVCLAVLVGGDAVTPVVTLFGVLITGIFVFMTLRVESGARKEAQAVAQTEARYHADRAARSAASSEARRVAEIEARNKADEVAGHVAREVAEREFERMREYFARR